MGAALVTGEAGQAGAYRGRITVYCIADALDRKALLSLLQVRTAGQGTVGQERIGHSSLRTGTALQGRAGRGCARERQCATEQEGAWHS